MDTLNRKIIDLHNEGKTVKQIRNKYSHKRLNNKYIVDLLIVHDTKMLYNVMSNKYDTLVIPSIINYNIRLND